MKPAGFNLLFLIVGLIGLLLSIYGWQRWHRVPWLIGIGFFMSFFISSLREILLRARGR
jgi:Na+/H+ antiporter NhaA